MQALLARRSREGLTYEELSATSGIPAKTLANWQFRLQREATEPAFTELVVEGDVSEALDDVLEVIGPRGHRVIVTSAASSYIPDPHETQKPRTSKSLRS